MVTPIEIGVLAVAIIALLLAVQFKQHIKALVINAVLGVLVLLVAEAAGLGVGISIWAVLVCAIAGIPGAILVILLAYLDIAFVAATMI